MISILHRIPIKTRFVLLASIVGLLLLIGLLYNLLTLAKLSDQTNKLYHQNLKGIHHIEQANLAACTSNLAVCQSLKSEIYFDRIKLEDRIKTMTSEFERVKTEYNTFQESYQADMQLINEHLFTFESNYDVLTDLMTEMEILLQSGEYEKTREIYLDKYSNKFSDMSKALGSIITSGVKQADANFAATQKTIRRIRMNTIIVFAFIVIFLLVSIYLINNSITPLLDKILQYIHTLSEGKIPGKIKIVAQDKTGEIQKALNQYIEGLQRAVNFANEIRLGNLESEFKTLSTKDELGNALLSMRQSLKDARTEEEKRKSEEEKHNWSTQGQTKFNDILRQHTNDLKELSYNVISNLVEYLHASQGGVFIINDTKKEEPYLELIASYAFNRRKYLQQNYRLGEGLVGACALEKKRIQLKKIPEGYIKITSGLGQANPRALLLVPLKIEDEVLGVLEITSFEIFKEHEVTFTEEIAGDIASTLNSVKISERTNRLLEQSKKQAETMKLQEKEMRQNFEELQTAQELAARREAEMKGIIRTLDEALFTAEFDLHGNVLRMNESLLKLLKIPKGAESEKNYRHFTNPDSKRLYPEGYNKFWLDIKEGEIKRKTARLTKDVWLAENFAPIFDNNNQLTKVLYIGIDISENKRQEKELKFQAKKLAEKEGEFERHISKYKKEYAELEQKYDRETDAKVYLKQILDSLPFYLSATDDELKWTYYNKALAEYLGVKPDEYIGKPCNYWNTALCKTESCAAKRAKEGVHQIVFEENGKNYVTNCVTLTDKDGKNIGYVETLQEITKIVDKNS